MVTQTEIPRRQAEEVSAPAKEGAYISGLVMEGARWDERSGQLDDSRHKELFAKMPIIVIKAVPIEKADVRDTYTCPVYRTQDRGHTYVFSALLKTKAPPSRWVMAGVALLMDVV